MMTAGGTVTCHTATPMVLVPTRTASVTNRRALPNMAPFLSERVWLPLSCSLRSISKVGGINVGERKRNMNTGYTETAPARKGRMTCAVYLMNERLYAPARTKLVRFADTSTTDATTVLNPMLLEWDRYNYLPILAAVNCANIQAVGGEILCGC